jgi:DNA sulfur modification protein DndE
MDFPRLKVCQETSSKLSMLKARTGLTPNILCRIGFSLSLNDPTIPNPDDYPPDSDREIDRHVLTGAWDPLFVAMIKERCKKDNILQEEIAVQFRAHVNRGVLLLFKRVKSVSDLKYILPKEFQNL